MADARMYIGSRTLGLACRFYARLGNRYTIGFHAGMEELLSKMAESAMDDRILILEESQVGERVGQMLWKIKEETLSPEMVPVSEIASLMERNAKLQEECVRLHNQAVTAQRRLKDVEDRLGKSQ